VSDATPIALERLRWSRLNHLQVGRYAEYLAKMEFTRYGFQVYTAEVDDRGIDFVARHERGPFLEVQVKSIRGYNYVFFPKDKFPTAPTLWACVITFVDEKEPEMYLVPSGRWEQPDRCFVVREYEGLKSKPEYGLNLSKRNMDLMSEFAFERSINTLATA
jgi:hypothetical protein